MQPSDTICLRFPKSKIEGHITLDGSKSISNRALIMQALCQKPFKLEGLSNSDDTKTLIDLLASNEKVKNAGHAGTTFRFLTAYYAVLGGEQILTGSERMKDRPIKPLVEALNSIGANIQYLEKEGFPPLKIGPYSPNNRSAIEIPATMSSQFISAILMVAPTLSNGLELRLIGQPVSMSYIQMTLKMMEEFGIHSKMSGNKIQIDPQEYIPKNYRIEADWSAASYYYSMAIICGKSDLKLSGLSNQGLQGDAVIAEIANNFGVDTHFEDHSIQIQKNHNEIPKHFEFDFLLCPDIAQTVTVWCAALGVESLFTGLQTLSIKETDRILALQQELQKIEVYLSALPEKFSKRSKKAYYLLSGKTKYQNTPEFETYDDHRMAMAFAPLALQNIICINDPMVVTKSYRNYWTDLSSIGFEIQ